MPVRITPERLYPQAEGQLNFGINMQVNGYPLLQL
jgi:hypothetical protein